VNKEGERMSRTPFKRENPRVFSSWLKNCELRDGLSIGIRLCGRVLEDEGRAGKERKGIHVVP